MEKVDNMQEWTIKKRDGNLKNQNEMLEIKTT